LTLPAKTFSTASQRCGIGDRRPPNKAAFDAALGEVPRHLLAAAVNHHHLDAAPAGRRDLRSQAIAGFRNDRAAYHRA